MVSGRKMVLVNLPLRREGGKRLALPNEGEPAEKRRGAGKE